MLKTSGKQNFYFTVLALKIRFVLFSFDDMFLDVLTKKWAKRSLSEFYTITLVALKVQLYDLYQVTRT